MQEFPHHYHVNATAGQDENVILTGDGIGGAVFAWMHPASVSLKP